METILIAGGTGLIGNALGNLLLKKGYKVRILSRRKLRNNFFEYFVWDVNNNYVEEKAFENISHIINLTGASIIDKRWTSSRKKEILNSRIQSANFLFDTIKKLDIPIKSFITSSAIGYYGSNTTDKIFIENDPPATDFIGSVCKKWEAASENFQQIGIRTVQIRTGVVLSKESGALPKMIKPIQLGLGSVLGNGNQYIPWIHIDDLCRIYGFAIENEKMNGAYNAVSPQHITQKEFTYLLAKKLGKKIILPAVPEFVLKIVMGEMSDLILNGSRISSEKIIQEGFQFEYADLKNTLDDMKI